MDAEKRREQGALANNPSVIDKKFFTAASGPHPTDWTPPAQLKVSTSQNVPVANFPPFSLGNAIFDDETTEIVAMFILVCPFVCL